MTHNDARRLVDRNGLLRHPSDLDLLIFFARHPRVLLASESLARFLGYDLKQIASSLDALLAARLLTRTQTTTHAARLYVFVEGDAQPEWLQSVLRLASTSDGRRHLRAALRSRVLESGAAGQGGEAEKPGPRRVTFSRQEAVQRDPPHVAGRRAGGDHHE